MTLASTLYGKRQPRHVSGRAAPVPRLGGALCLDVVNTVDGHEAAGADDHFASGYVNALEWFAQAEVLEADEATRLAGRAGKDPREAAAVRKRLVALRAALYEIVIAIIGGGDPPAPAVAILNDEVAQARSRERLAVNNGTLAWQEADRLALDAPLNEVARSAAALLTSPQAGKIRQCANPTCQRVFLDTSKNGSRRYCSTSGCGSRIRVQRFRARQKETR